MKLFHHLPFLSALTAAATCLPLIPIAQAEDLTPEQVASIRARLEAMQDTIEGKTSERNRSAWSVFLSASQSDKEAIELFERCTKIVDFDREDREESEFRDWQDKQKGNYKDDQYMESLRLQLRWLAITCKAAEAEKFETVLPEVLSYLDSLTTLEELPGGPALGAVGGSIFVRAYELERIIGQNEGWEPVPYNIAGIYQNIILPHLRVENPPQLMAAWEKRIAQETRMVEFIKEKQEAELRGGRDDKLKIQDQQRRQQNRGVLKKYDEDDFIRDTLPQLHWSRMVDKYQYIDKVAAAQEMLTFLDQYITNRKAVDWLNQMQTLISNAVSPGIIERDTPAPATTNGPVTAESLGLE